MTERYRQAYQRYVESYTHYARMRGFTTEINDWPYVRRSFLECWAEPGFHRFWQVWNPGISYFVYRAYLGFGGRRHWVLPVLGAFILNGIAHTLVAAPFAGHWSWVLVVAFACFAILTILSRWLAPRLRQDRWPWPVNVVVNVALVSGCMDLGFRVDHILR
jgi:hypothetical protein